MEILTSKCRFLRLMVIASLLFLGITSCKVTLAPEYNRDIVEEANSVSEQTLVFLESVSSGTSKEHFFEREGTYNELIGIYEALCIKAKARPIPSNKASKKIDKLLEDKGISNMSEDYPSSVAFEGIAKTLKKMKDTDKNKEISSAGIALFKGQIMIFLDQAITYESFLKR